MGIKRTMVNTVMGLAVSGIVLSGAMSVQAAPSESPKSRTNQVLIVNEKGETEVILNKMKLRQLVINHARALKQAGLVSDESNLASLGYSSSVIESYSYTFEDMDDTTMYAKSGVNVRDLPSTDGAKVGKLTAGQEVVVTGECKETGWYRIRLSDDDIAYVSNKYLSKDKPVANTGSGSSTGTQSAQNTQSAGQQGNGSVNNNAVQSDASQNTEVSQNTDASQNNQTSRSSGTSQDFLNYLNQQRSAAGLGQISWDSGYAAEAQRRAEAIVNNFSHDGSGNYLENLYKGDSGNVADWFGAWSASPGHYATMYNSDAVSGACAYVEIDGYYYVVLVVHTEVKVMSAEEWNASKDDMVNSGELTKIEGENGDSYVQSGAGGEVTDQDLIDAANALLREAGLIP